MKFHILEPGGVSGSVLIRETDNAKPFSPEKVWSQAENHPTSTHR
jgi:hypothetical protein